MISKETHHISKEDSDSDDEDDMADIKSKKMARKFTSKTMNRKEKSCQPNKNLNRDEKDDDSDVEGCEIESIKQRTEAGE